MTGKITFAKLIASFGDPIDTSAVAEAITDNDLVRVPEEAQHQAGFRWPVAVTGAVHAQCVAWDGNALAEASRLATLLRGASLAVARSKGGAPAPFRFSFVSARFPVFEVEEQLTVSFGHDSGQPVVVVALSPED